MNYTKSITLRFQFLPVLFILLIIGLAGCNKNSDDPEPITTSSIGKYAGKMVTTGGLTNQGSAIVQTMAITVEMTSGSKENEVRWKIIGPFGDYNDPLTATIDGTKFTTQSQKLTYGPGDEVVFEGTGTLIGQQLTVTLREDDGQGQYTHEITATRK
ncbi:hypothetical protein [Larkinella sp.]|uniref:hypothetical protein n=1 Tax=Larkinella sp. TaxID=2034517 RepID=UPI003BAD8364